MIAIASENAFVEVWAIVLSPRYLSRWLRRCGFTPRLERDLFRLPAFAAFPTLAEQKLPQSARRSADRKGLLLLPPADTPSDIIAATADVRTSELRSVLYGDRGNHAAPPGLTIKDPGCPIYRYDPSQECATRY